MGTPVTLTMKKKNQIGTFVGGLCSICLITLGIFYSGLIYFFNFSGEPIYESEIRPLYLDIVHNKAYEIETTKLNLGVKIKVIDEVIDIKDLAKYVNVQFVSYNSSSKEYENFEAVPCTDLFLNMSYRNNQTAYLCPDVEEIMLQSDLLQDTSLSFSLYIDYCSQGTETSECEHDETVDSIL